MTRLEIDQRIEQASLPECNELTERIIKEQPVFCDKFFASLYRRRAAILESRGQKDVGQMEQSVADILWYNYGATSDQVFQVLPRAGDMCADPLAQWRDKPVSVFANFWEHSQESNVPIPVKVILVQGLWELRSLWQKDDDRRLPKTFDVIRETIKLHIEAANWIIDREAEPLARGMISAQHWKTAAILSEGIGHPEIVADHLSDIQNAQKKFLEEAPLWVLTMIESEASLAVSKGKRRSDLVGDARLEELLHLLNEIKAKLPRRKNFQNDVIVLQARIERYLGRGPDQKELAHRRASMLEKQAKAEKSGIGAHMLWKEAAAEYHQAGLREDASRSKAESRAALRRADEQGEITEITTLCELNDMQLDSALRPFLADTDDVSVVLQRMASCLFVPSLQTSHTVTDPPTEFGQFATTLPLVDDRSLAEIEPGTEAVTHFSEHRSLHFEILEMTAKYISEIFGRLRGERFQLHHDDLVAHLTASPFVEPDDLPFIHVAVDHFIRGECITVMHIMVPRVEQMIRRILKAAGTDITALRNGELRERPLGELLRAAEKDGALPPALVRLLQATLSEEWGMNLRNRIAHGLAVPSDCSQTHVDRMMHIALYLARYRISDENA